MDTNTLNTVEPDECCAEKLNSTLLQSPDFPSPYYCPKCGTEWRPFDLANNTTGVNIRRWQPIVECAII